MNTKIYRQVHTLATELVEAAEGGDDDKFDQLYAQLQALCVNNETDAINNHPVQWETLADFTQDSAEALALYEKALSCAQTLGASDYMASISYAMAALLAEDPALDEHGEKALLAVRRAREYAQQIDDAELKGEIAQLLKKLQH